MAELKPELKDRLKCLEAKAYMEWGLSDEESKELDSLIALANLYGS